MAIENIEHQREDTAWPGSGPAATWAAVSAGTPPRPPPWIDCA